MMPGLLFSEKPENERDECGNEKAGCKGEGKGEVLSLDVDVTRETAQPGEFACECNDDADQGNEEPNENQ
jgi:hypothetical protein